MQWRDSGYAAGAIIAGLTADFFELRIAIGLVAFLTFLSGIIVVFRMRETLQMKNENIEVKMFLMGDAADFESKKSI